MPVAGHSLLSELKPCKAAANATKIHCHSLSHCSWRSSDAMHMCDWGLTWDKLSLPSLWRILLQCLQERPGGEGVQPKGLGKIPSLPKIPPCIAASARAPWMSSWGGGEHGYTSRNQEPCCWMLWCCLFEQSFLKTGLSLPVLDLPGGLEKQWPYHSS